MVQFFDETGYSNLPAGVNVSIFAAGALVGSAFSQPGGLVNLSVVQGVAYVAEFAGFQGPAGTASFTGGVATSTTQVIVPAYRSPSLSVVGYTIEQANVLPTGPGWYSDAAKSPGGVTWAVLTAGAALLGQLDFQTQVAISTMRLQSCVGSDIDSWVFDFFGGILPRYFLETDTLYIARVIAILTSTKLTCQGIQQVVVAFYNSIGWELSAAYAQNITFDGQGGYDTQGGYDEGQSYSVAAPVVLVWDLMTQPALAAQFGIKEPRFVVMVGFDPPSASAWFLDHGYVDFDSYLVTQNNFTVSLVAPDPRLAALVNLVKSAAFRPVYITYLTVV
jgi:hypothetical protein